MTDIEFIQALRAVAKKYEGKPVATCETNISNMATDAADRIERLCDEINRQKAEIDHFADIGKMYSEVRSDAIREFAERLRTKRGSHGELWGGDIDYLVKEMTEGER